MNHLRAVRVSLALALACCAAAAKAPSAQPERLQDRGAVTYTLRPDITSSPPALHVEMAVHLVHPESQLILQMPEWSPGDYHLMHSGAFVRDVTASGSGGAALPVQHPAPYEWRLNPGQATEVTVTYDLPNEPPGYFSENVLVTPAFCFFNGPATYMYVAGHKDWPCGMQLIAPAGWAVESPMDPGPSPVSFGAGDYDTLADSPVLASSAPALSVKTFKVRNVPVRVLFFRHPESVPDQAGIAGVLERIVTAETAMMGRFPCARYDFFLDVNGPGGGLEHLNACRIGFPARVPVARFAPMAAHEFFHLWNVKRIRPYVLGPFDYIHPPVTGNLWFAEGVTSYYEEVLCHRAGITSSNEFLASLHRTLSNMLEGEAGGRTSADASSRRVWEAGNSAGFGESYYVEGEVIGMCLDLAIRHETAGRRSLDDVMRYLYAQYALPKPGYDEDGILQAVNLVTGRDMTDLYERLVRSTQPMPVAQCLGYAGLDADLAPRPGADAPALAVREAWLAVPGGM